MTADRLARHYPSLKPDERLALMLAAAGRGDEVEHERLTAAAPRATFTALQEDETEAVEANGAEVEAVFRHAGEVPPGRCGR